METRIYKGQANIYNPTTQDIIKRRIWREKFTKEQVLIWLDLRDYVLRTFNEYDDVKWRLWEDGCYRMTAYRHAKKSKAGRQLKAMAVCYIFTPVE